MQQYLDMRAENPAAVLLFRLGDFYESFFGDATRVSRALDLVLTHRGTDDRGVEIPMCGIPWHAADNYFARLIKQGISVAIAEQMETPEEAKERGHKQIERKIVRVLTPGTLTDDNLLTPGKSNYLAAVSAVSKPRGAKGAPRSGKGAAGTLRIAAADISTGELLVGDSTDIEGDLVKLAPAEVLYDEAEAESPAFARIRAAWNTVPLNRRQYDTFAGADDSLKMLAAYLKMTQRGAEVRLMPPRKLWGAAELLIDASTWKSLEIDEPINAGGKTLLDIIDRTKTAAGARKLRSWLRALPGDADIISARQDHIEHLVRNQNLAKNLAAAMSRLPDVGRALSRLDSGRGLPRDMRAVLEFLRTLPDIKRLGREMDSAYAEILGAVSAFDALCAELSRAVGENLPPFFRSGQVIRAGYSKELDEARDMAGDSKSIIAALQSGYAKASGIAALKIKYNGILGYFVEVPSKSAGPLQRPESGFIHRQTLSGVMRFSTARLADLEGEIKNADMRAGAIEAEIINNLIGLIKNAAEEINKVADILAETDAFLSLADAASTERWTRPKIAKEPVFDIKGGRHPVVESTLRGQAKQFVKNDSALRCKGADERQSIALLTGPNMAGKSTYLRQNALIVVLAHLGSFVPAEAAEIGIADQLFSRVGASDNLATGQSTFMFEMSETANILNRATERSFIIFDEIGRGTATFDGMAIARAVLEYANDLGARCLFATHYHELTALNLGNVRNLTLQVAEHNNEIIFMHKVAPGAASHSYGIHVAKMAGMPARVVAAAEKILAELESGKSSGAAGAEPTAPTAADPDHTAEENEESDEYGEQMSLF